MADKSKGASLAPEDHAGAGQIPDGDYTITDCYAGSFDYNGQVPEGVPAILVMYKSSDGQSYEQPYKAGDNEHLVASDDHERFIHPNGGEARIYKGGAASQWLGSLVKAGFNITGDSIKQFKGLKVTLVNVAAPTGKTKDKEGKVIPLVAKVLGTAGTAKASPNAGKASAPPAPATTPATASHSNGLDETARDMILTILAGAPDNTITRVKLSTQVMLAASKDPALKPNMPALKKLAGDASWLVDQAEVSGWATDGEVISIN